MAKVLGGQVIALLIKDKRYRKPLTDFVDELRVSPNFRDRQMYLVTAAAALKADKEVFKKHFAKAIGNEMCQEKVTIVKIRMAKLVSKVERGYSKSADKAYEWLKATDKTGEVTQYLGDLTALTGNSHLRQRRYIDPENHRVTLKQDELSQTLTSMNSSISKSQGGKSGHSNDTDQDEGEAKELAEIQSLEKTVNIRFCNYSIIMRAQNFPSGMSNQLLALLGGYGKMLLQAEGGDKTKVMDKSEDEMVGKEEAKAEEKKTQDEEDEDYEDDDW